MAEQETVSWSEESTAAPESAAKASSTFALPLRGPASASATSKPDGTKLVLVERQKPSLSAPPAGHARPCVHQRAIRPSHHQRPAAITATTTTAGGDVEDDLVFMTTLRQALEAYNSDPARAESLGYVVVDGHKIGVW